MHNTNSLNLFKTVRITSIFFNIRSILPTRLFRKLLQLSLQTSGAIWPVLRYLMALTDTIPVRWPAFAVSRSSHRIWSIPHKTLKLLVLLTDVMCFHLPARQNSPASLHTVFCISCYRQMPSDVRYLSPLFLIGF